MKHFLANEWDRQRALKRGGGRKLIALDDDSAESRYRLEPRDDLSADKIYERRWALTLLDTVLGNLRAEIAQTVSTASEIEAEIRCLFAALGA